MVFDYGPVLKGCPDSSDYWCETAKPVSALGCVFYLYLVYCDINTIQFVVLNMYIGLDTVIHIYVWGLCTKKNHDKYFENLFEI